MPQQQSEARRRLAALMDERRLELRLTWRDVAEHGGVSLRALANARTSDSDIRPLTRAGIEDGLQWERGSVGVILAKGDPAPAGSPAQHRSRLFAEMPRKIQAAVSPFVAKIQAAVAEAVWAGVPLTGEAVFPDSPLNARRWDAVAERGRVIYPDEGGFTPSEIAELVAIMQLGDARQEFGGAAAGLPERT